MYKAGVRRPIRRRISLQFSKEEMAILERIATFNNVNIEEIVRQSIVNTMKSLADERSNKYIMRTTGKGIITNWVYNVRNEWPDNFRARYMQNKEICVKTVKGTIVAIPPSTIVEADLVDEFNTTVASFITSTGEWDDPDNIIHGIRAGRKRRSGYHARIQRLQGYVRRYSSNACSGRSSGIVVSGFYGFVDNAKHVAVDAEDTQCDS